MCKRALADEDLSGSLPPMSKAELTCLWPASATIALQPGADEEVSYSKPLRSSLLKLNPALESLRVLLQDMSAPDRKAAIQGMPSRVRSALVHFMEKLPNESKAGSLPHDVLHTSRNNSRPARCNSIKDSHSNDEALGSHRECMQRHPGHAMTGIRRVGAGSYRACIDIKALRMYASAQSNIEGAMEQHKILVQMRQRLAEADAFDFNFWHRAEDVYKMCLDILDSNATSEGKLGLCVFVSLRADRWLGRRYHITSPVLPLSKALTVHSHLLRARQTSWDALREEWVHMMMWKRQSLSAGLSRKEAETLADAARRDRKSVV